MNPTMLGARGETIDLLNPDMTPIDIETIAHALGQINRFGGHAAQPHSVLRHSIFVAAVAKELAADTCTAEDMRLLVRAAVLHDAHEAYVGDVTSPVKEALRAMCLAVSARSAFDVLESCWAQRVEEALLPEYDPCGDHEWIADIVHRADMIARYVERCAFFPGSTPTEDPPEPFDVAHAVQQLLIMPEEGAAKFFVHLAKEGFV